MIRIVCVEWAGALVQWRAIAHSILLYIYIYIYCGSDASYNLPIYLSTTYIADCRLFTPNYSQLAQLDAFEKLRNFGCQPANYATGSVCFGYFGADNLLLIFFLCC